MANNPPNTPCASSLAWTSGITVSPSSLTNVVGGSYSSTLSGSSNYIQVAPRAFFAEEPASFLEFVSDILRWVGNSCPIS